MPDDGVEARIKLAWGLKDPAATRRLLARVMAKLSALNDFSDVVRERRIQETPVYCLGPGVDAQDAFPDGEETFALLQVDRYLVLGSWQDAQSLLGEPDENGPATDVGSLPDLIDRNQQANLLLYVPRQAAQHFNELAAAERDMEQDVKSKLEEISAEKLNEVFQDEEFSRKLYGHLERLARATSNVERSAAQRNIGVLIIGKHEGNFYELVMEHPD
jgi:hypothetical protein